MKNLLLFSCFFFISMPFFCQEENKQYLAGESLSDKYKFSNIQAIEEDNAGGLVIIRSYYGGVIMHLKGYYIEHYDKELQLINEYNYAIEDVEVMGVYVKDDRITILEVNYDKLREAYVYWANTTSLTDLDFKRTKLFHFKRKKERQINYLKEYTTSFTDKFYSQLLFDANKSVFTISIDSKQKGKDVHQLYVYDTKLHKKGVYNLEKEIETRHLVFENIEYDPVNNSIYLLGKGYEKGKRTKAISLKYAYQLFKLKDEKITVQQFSTQDRYASSLKLILGNDKLKCVGFYSNSRDNKYRGLLYTELNKISLAIEKQKFNPFSDQFMIDKYGAEVDKELKNLTFRGIHQSPDGAIIFNAEECYVNTNLKNRANDSRKSIKRFHYNDIVCAKLNKNGDMEWARNINKAESTEGDEAYVSYTSAFSKENNCFFINSGAIPQKISKDRILFKRGYSRSPNVYMIDINDQGEMQYKEVVNNKEIRIPLMVSRGLVSKKGDAVFFLARRGTRKQLVKVFL